MFALIENQAVKFYPYTIGDLRKANSNISFPKNPNDTLLELYGMFRVYFCEQPKYNAITQTLEEHTPVFDTVAQRWIQVLGIRNLSENEIIIKAQAKKAEVRLLRDALLLETDWRFRSDLTPSQEWKDYCQALRDIPSQSGFPWEIVWPAQPE